MVLTLEDIKKNASSVFTEEPSQRTSERYTFVPTYRIIQDMDKLNWKVVDAKEVKSRAKDRIGFQKHMISFENDEIKLEKVNDVKPRLLITNSHDGLNSFKMQFGVFRLVCSNGLVIAEEIYDNLKIRHQGYEMTEIENSVWEYIQTIPKISNDIMEYKNTKLNYEQKYEMASKALDIRFPKTNDKPINTEHLLKVRRTQDSEDDLWTVFNVIQENIINPNISSTNKGKRFKGIKGINKNMLINKALWILMAQMYSQVK